MPPAWWTLQASGLESEPLTAVLIVVSALFVFWGLHRYRRSFSKFELGLSLALAAGVLLMAVAPELYGWFASFLHIEERPYAIALLATVVLTILVLVLFARTDANRGALGSLTRSLAIETALDGADLPTDRPLAVVVIPAYDEADSVASVVESVPEAVGKYAVVPLVVSDGSTDGTAQVVAETRALVVEHRINLGQGAALRTGFEIALAEDADVVATIDADGQHPADRLGDLIEPIDRGAADYVLGSRYLGTDRTNNGTARRSGVRVFTALVNLIAKTDVTDCTNGFRAIRGDRLADLTLTEQRFSAPELLIEARKKGLTIHEIPIEVRERDVGESKKPKLGYALGLARTILVTWLR